MHKIKGPFCKTRCMWKNFCLLIQYESLVPTKTKTLDCKNSSEKSLAAYQICCCHISKYLNHNMTSEVDIWLVLLVNEAFFQGPHLFFYKIGFFLQCDVLLDFQVKPSIFEKRL